MAKGCLNLEIDLGRYNIFDIFDYDVMWCDVMWCDVMWCDVMW